MFVRFVAFIAISVGSNICFAETTEKAIQSGLRPGDRTFPFHVQDVTGPQKGQTLCYACAFGKNSVINVQARRIDDELLAVLKQLDGMVAPADKIKANSRHAFLVYLTDDPDAAAKELEHVAQKLQLKNIPLTIYDELSGPKPYKLSDEAEVTVMMWEDAKVTINHAFATGGMDKNDVKVVLQSAMKHLSPK